MRELMDRADLLLLCVLCVSWTHGDCVVVAVLNRQRDEWGRANQLASAVIIETMAIEPGH